MTSTEWRENSDETRLMLMFDFQRQEDISEGTTKSREIQTRGAITVSSTQAGINTLGNVARCCDVLL
jgi:hypothetical protein